MFLGFLIFAALPLAESPPSDPAFVHPLAWIDLQRVPPIERPFIRYLWIPENLVDNAKLVSFGLNWLSSTTVIRRPDVIGDRLIRVDLRHYCHTESDLKRWIKTWEEFQFDPNFSILITADTINLLKENGAELPKIVRGTTKTQIDITVPKYEEDGQTFSNKWVSVIRLQGRHVDPVSVANLERETLSAAPVVKFDYFLMRALSSIKDNGVYKDIFGGLYYDFIGIRKSDKKGVSDLDLLFEDLGIVDDASKTKAQVKIDRLSAEKRVAMLNSKVTGKQRMVLILPTLTGIRKVVLITQDAKDSSVDILQNVFMNLLDFKPDASEVIWIAPNGSQKYVLFNNQGKLQDEVPPDIANDHTIPTPHTKRLQTIGCIVCHGSMDGWQPIPNEVQANRKRVDIFGDVSRKKDSVQETLNLLASKYAGNADQLIMDLRRELIGATLQMTGPYKESGDQTEVYKRTAEGIGKLRDSYWYAPVNAAIALKEIGRGGFFVDGKKPQEVLGGFLPPDLSSKDDLLGIVPEDVRVAQLLAGKGISRAHWETLKGFVLGRIRGKSK